MAGSAPVIDLGQSPGLISTAVALTSAGSVVLSLKGVPHGSVTYTATGLLHEMALADSATPTAIRLGSNVSSRVRASPPMASTTAVAH